MATQPVPLTSIPRPRPWPWFLVRGHHDYRLDTNQKNRVRDGVTPAVCRSSDGPGAFVCHSARPQPNRNHHCCGRHGQRSRRSRGSLTWAKFTQSPDAAYAADGIRAELAATVRFRDPEARVRASPIGGVLAGLGCAVVFVGRGRGSMQTVLSVRLRSGGPGLRVCPGERFWRLRTEDGVWPPHCPQRPRCVRVHQ